MNERARIVAILEDETEVASDCVPRHLAEMTAYEFGYETGYYVSRSNDTTNGCDGTWETQRVVSMRLVPCEGAE